jgi:SAM-dependent methyltransferase
MGWFQGKGVPLAFYEQLSRSYDALFPVSAAQRTLLRSFAEERPGLRVVDAGCGSGGQLLPLVELGALCTGFDPDPAMAELARRKLSPFSNARIEVGGFGDLLRLVPPGSADLLLCLGNSLVHVPQDAAARFLAEAFVALADGGLLLLQILNYDRFAPGGASELPPLRSADGSASMTRRYRWEGDRTLRFQTQLTLAGDPQGPVDNDIPLYPIRPGELREMLATAGFRDPVFHSDFALSAFSNDSEGLVCLARKK